MKKCKYESLIDSYVLDKLQESEKENFEEHYFNCPHCFEKTAARTELIEVLKKKGDFIFEEVGLAKKEKTVTLWEKTFSFFTPRQWAVAVSAAILLAVVFAFVPLFKERQPQFVISGDETVRGESLSLISPVIDVSSMPSYFEWKKIGDNIEYKITLSNHDLLWTATTKENRILLPTDIQNQMKSGEKYSWQVKAYSPQGTLIAVSSSVQFKIAGTN